MEHGWFRKKGTRRERRVPSRFAIRLWWSAATMDPADHERAVRPTCADRDVAAACAVGAPAMVATAPVVPVAPVVTLADAEMHARRIDVHALRGGRRGHGEARERE